MIGGTCFKYVEMVLPVNAQNYLGIMAYFKDAVTAPDGCRNRACLLTGGRSVVAMFYSCQRYRLEQKPLMILDKKRMTGDELSNHRWAWVIRRRARNRMQQVTVMID